MGGFELPERAARPVKWGREPELTEWMLEHDHGQSAMELSEEFMAAHGFPLSRPQVSLFRSAHGNCVRRARHHNNSRLLPIGTERVMHRGDGHYVIVKTKMLPDKPGSKDNWKLKHVMVWEQASGRKVAKGDRVYFADGDHDNFDPANLVMVPQTLVRRVNGMEWHDRESLELAVAMAALNQEAIKAHKARKRTCEVCGMQYDLTDYMVGKSGWENDPRTCGECRANHRKAPFTRKAGTATCDVCGREYERHSYRQRRCWDCSRFSRTVALSTQKRMFKKYGSADPADWGGKDERGWWQ